MKSISLCFVIAASLFATALHGSTLNLTFTQPGNTDLEADTAYGLIPVKGSNWNLITTFANGSFPAATPLVDQSGNQTAATVALNSYGLDAYANFTAFDPLLRTCVRDYPNGTTPGFPQIKVENIPYAQYDVFVYMTNNAQDIDKNTPLTIAFDGGSDSDYYYMDGILTKTTTNQSTGWGSRFTTALTLGQNCIRIPDCAGSSFIVKGYRNAVNLRRANICAMQVVERKTITLSGETTIAAGDYAGTSLEVINTGSTLSTLTIEGALNCASLICSGESFTLKIDNPITAIYAEINTPLTVDISPCAPTLASTLTTAQTIPLLTAPIAAQSAISIAPAPLLNAYPTISQPVSPPSSATASPAPEPMPSA